MRLGRASPCLEEGHGENLDEGGATLSVFLAEVVTPSQVPLSKMAIAYDDASLLANVKPAGQSNPFLYGSDSFAGAGGYSGVLGLSLFNKDAIENTFDLENTVALNSFNVPGPDGPVDRMLIKGRYVLFDIGDATRLRNILVAMTCPEWDETRWRGLRTIQEFCGYGLKAVKIAQDGLTAACLNKRITSASNIISKQREFFDIMRAKKIMTYNPDFEKCEWMTTGETSWALEAMKMAVRRAKRGLVQYSSGDKFKERKVHQDLGKDIPKIVPSKQDLFQSLETALPFYMDVDPQKGAKENWRKDLEVLIRNVDSLTSRTVKLNSMRKELKAGRLKKPSWKKVQLEKKLGSTLLEQVPLKDFEPWQGSKYRPARFAASQMEISSWLQLNLKLRNNDLLHMLLDPDYQLETILKHEEDTINAIVAWSSTLNILTRPHQFDSFVTLESGPLRQFKSAFRFYADNILAAIANELRKNPLAADYLINKMPNPADADLSVLKEAIGSPNWLDTRPYHWNTPVHVEHRPYLPQHAMHSAANLIEAKKEEAAKQRAAFEARFQ